MASEKGGWCGCVVILLLLGGGIYALPVTRDYLELYRIGKRGRPEGYIAFMIKDPEAWAATDAARRAAEMDGQQGTLVRALELLGKNDSGRPVPFLAEHLAHPVTEVRAVAAESMAELAEVHPQAVRKTLKDFLPQLSQASLDRDPRVRSQARCLMWLSGAEPPPLFEQVDSSPYSEARFADCKRRLERALGPPGDS